MVSFLIDAVLAVMLVTATAYLIIVNQRLKLLRNGQSEINALVSTFSRSIDDTDASMKRLVGSATEVAGRLSEDLDRARAVKEDMALILGSCERATRRMEESVQHARALLRRLDEGAMQRTARHAPAAPTAPAAPIMELREPPPPPSAPAAAAAAAAAMDAAAVPAFLGNFDEPAGDPDQTAPDPTAPDPADPDPADPAEAAAPERRKPVGAFYARLRTIGTEA